MVFDNKKYLNQSGNNNQQAARDIHNDYKYNYNNYYHTESLFEITPQELEDVINFIYDNRLGGGETIVTAGGDFNYVKMEKKNNKNNLSDQFFNIMQEVDKYNPLIKNVLGTKEELAEKYYSVARDIKTHILAIKEDKKLDTYDKVFEYLKTHFIKQLEFSKNNDNNRSQKKYIMQNVLYHMYLNCDIGEK